MTDDAKLTAALEQIRERSRVYSRGRPNYRSVPGAHAVGVAADVPRLLAAIESVLKLADSAKGALFGDPVDCTYNCNYGPCNCSGESRPLAWTLDPAAVREVVANELGGKPEREPFILPPEGGTFPINGMGIVRPDGEPTGGTVTFTPSGHKPWHLCPNEPRCPHAAVFHDIDEPDDPLPRCCAEGCLCGKKPDPGTVMLTEHA